MPATARVRLATTEDVEALAALAHRTFVDTYADQNPPGLVAAHADAAFTPERLAAELADPTTTTLVADDRRGAGRLRGAGRDHAAPRGW